YHLMDLPYTVFLEPLGPSGLERKVFRSLLYRPGLTAHPFVCDFQRSFSYRLPIAVIGALTDRF
ncbi:MAG: hypothetical protein ACQEXV_22635, partial [Bacillota bacterium]